MIFGKKARILLAGVALVAAGAQPLKADIPYLQNYETNTDDWSIYTGGSISQVSSGGGVVGAPSFGGGSHAEITNALDAYDALSHYGAGGYTYFGNPQGSYPGDWYQSMDLYVDLNTWTPPTNPSVNGFFVDSSPSDTTANSDYDDENNFAIYVPTAGTVEVKALYSVPLATITQTGWYRIYETFEAGGPTVANSFHVVDLTNNVLMGSVTLPSTMPSASLGGNGYLWVTGWQNGFANDVLAIDNLQTAVGTPSLPSPAPEPASLGLLALGGVLMLKRVRV